MLLDLFKEKCCFKLVLGAGNENIDEIEKLVYIYSLAGANFFDVCAKKEAILAAKRGIEKSGIKTDRYLCISVGTKSDPHIQKASIDNTNCIKCGKCKNVCLENAIEERSGDFLVNLKKCIGCARCADVCSSKSIKFESMKMNMLAILPPLIDAGIDCVEFHISSRDKDKIYTDWEDINKIYNGTLSISVSGKNMADDDIVSILKRMLANKTAYSTIVQADGNPMSGGADDYNTTLQAIACADVIEKSKLPVYVLLSGGTNSKTTELAKLCNVNANGIAIGSFARKIVKEYIIREDFYNNQEIVKKALERAKHLVDISLENMK